MYSRKRIFRVLLLGGLLLGVVSWSLPNGDPVSKYPAPVPNPSLTLDAFVVLDEDTPIDTTVYDGIYHYPAGGDSLYVTVDMAQNWIYMLSYETYTPYADDFDMDLFITSPTSLGYHMVQDNTSVANNIRAREIRYGAGESGNHLIEFRCMVSQDMNIHIMVAKSQHLVDYYQSRTEISVDRQFTYLANVSAHHPGRTSVEFHLPVIEDTEYWVNLFRISRLSWTSIIANQYYNPAVTMNITLGGDLFVYYPEVITLPGEIMQFDVKTGQEPFLKRFGSHETGVATVNMSFNFPALPVNFAFLMYKTDLVGDGPAEFPDNESYYNYNETDEGESPIPTAEETGETASEFFARVWAGVDGFISVNRNIFLAVTAGVIALLFTLAKINDARRVKTAGESNVLENDKKFAY